VKGLTGDRIGAILRSLVVYLIASGATAQSVDPGQELWGRTREHAAASVAGLPKYSCTETMERLVYAPSGHIEFRERLRLEVLVKETAELFAWPGSMDFAAEPLETWIGTGAIGTGNFAAQLLNLFQISAATIKYAGLETGGQDSLHRFDFHVPRPSSRSTIDVQGKSAATAYSGSLWVKQDSLDIVRLETRAEEIPSDLDCREARQPISYSRIRLGIDERMLPSGAELALVNRSGREGRNTVAFSKCRHYAAETSLSFTDSPDPAPSAPQGPRLELPANIALVLRLDQAISIRDAAAGDPVVARLDKEVISGAVTLPRGTRIIGRIRRLEQHFQGSAPALVALQFFVAETPAGSVNFSARLTGPRGTPDKINVIGDKPQLTGGVAGLEIEDDGRRTGVGSFRVKGTESSLPRGFRTVWETR